MPVHVELGHDNPQGISVELSDPPRVVLGADALTYPGLARTFIQYAILCLKERLLIKLYLNPPYLKYRDEESCLPEEEFYTICF